MPEQKTVRKARSSRRAGKSPSTQAGEFVREEIHHVREGKHGARNTKQAIAIGLSKARKAGVKVGKNPNKKSASSTSPKKKTAAKGVSRTRSQATKKALKREPRSAASSRSLSRQAHESAKKRGQAAMKRASQKALRTKGKSGLKKAARKAARTREQHASH
ncbi:MAG TPA: DUF6496 domain-containing protein [Pseudobdellovibrionaceae bacterium]|nr:DUF6496 domain-containing protein [Pseudobdellovibrionaceae bacterium]